ncbi:Alanyl-tRNA synthetase [Hordeum vulgare]|nr:Alanyl-tRNA synthetase [Hordeum vulgare]
MAIADEEATPLVIDDWEDDKPAKWLLAGRILHRNLLHIQTISGALKPAWDEVQFDRLSLWARVPNLPYNLRNDAWGKLIAQQIDKNATTVQFDHVGGFLRARVSIEVNKPLRRWILIDSAKRKKVDMYDIPYEHVPHFCFSCGRLGHSELYCPNPGPRDAKGDLPFGPKLRASDDWKKAASGESSNKEHYSGTSNQRESNNSTTSTKGGNVEVNSPVKNRTNYKRKDVPKQAYRRVDETKLLITDGSAATAVEVGDHDMNRDENEWRVMRGILPDESTLKYRHIRDTSMCKLCLLADENLEHALIHCSHAHSFWVEAQALLDFQLPTLHPDSWRKDILTDPRFSPKDRATIITIMWSIWSSRNRWTHDGESFDPMQSIKYTREALALLEIPKAQAVTLPGYGWQPPEGNQVKINTDAAVDILRQQCTAGGVARSRSSLLGAWAKPHAGVTDPLIAETLALREGVIFASLRGFSDVVMETDCQEVVNL